MRQVLAMVVVRVVGHFGYLDYQPDNLVWASTSLLWQRAVTRYEKTGLIESSPLHLTSRATLSVSANQPDPHAKHKCHVPTTTGTTAASNNPDRKA